MDAVIEIIVDGFVRADRASPSSSTEALDQAREAAPDTNVGHETSAGGIISEEPQDQSSALKAEEEVGQIFQLVWRKVVRSRRRLHLR